ncbi:fibroblast growth factor 1 isoform X2 [Parasteatoda tepidariorum]|uniref:fibroblast growth factor 1 isoform X2 n=1 Tax=Parasteatoda tepidariorum TaxID=114398 RepID=UPI001C71B34A|nr:fibroblast growth factor 1 isoform X2 [Parasteatoda tepidariorum]
MKGHKQTFDPTALGHHQHRKMASSADQKNSRVEVDRGIPSHVGPEKQLHSGTGYNLVIDSEGGVYGTREPYNEEAILQFHSRKAGEVQIKGKKSHLYLGMNERGKIYAELDEDSENTWFRELYEDGWNRYVWLGNDKEWYVGIKKSGKMKKGHRTKHQQHAVKFVPRSPLP